MVESRTYVVVSQTTVTASAVQTDYVRLLRPAIAATFLANIITASGNIQVVIQRGISTGSLPGSTGLLVNKAALETDVQWIDWASFTTTTTAGKQVLSLVRTSTTSPSSTVSEMTTSGNMGQNSIIGGSIGTLFRAGYKLTGNGPSFQLHVVAEFEF